MHDFPPIAASADARGPQRLPPPPARGAARLQTLAALAVGEGDPLDLDALRCAAQSLREIDRHEVRALPPARLARLALCRPRLLARGLREGWWDGPRPAYLPPPPPEGVFLAGFASAAGAAIDAARPAAEVTLHSLGSLLGALAAGHDEDTVAVRARLLRRAATTVARLVAPALRAAPPARAWAGQPAADASEAEVTALRWQMTCRSLHAFDVLVGLLRANYVLQDMRANLPPGGPLHAHAEAVFGRTQERCEAAVTEYRAVRRACWAGEEACDALFPFIDTLEADLDALAAEEEAQRAAEVRDQL